MARRDKRKSIADNRKRELLSNISAHRSDITHKKKALVKQIAESKDELTEQIKTKVNVPKIVTSKVKSTFASSFSNNPTNWFIGSAVGGLIISKIFFGTVGTIFRKPKIKKSSNGLLYTLAGMAARPMLKSFLIGKAQNYVAHKFLAQPPHYDQPPSQASYQDQYNSENRY